MGGGSPDWFAAVTARSQSVSSLGGRGGLGTTTSSFSFSAALSAATAVTVEGTAGAGVAAGEDDIFASTQMSGLDATTVQFTFQNSFGISYVAQASDVVKFGIDTAFTATTATLSIELWGYLE